MAVSGQNYSICREGREEEVAEKVVEVFCCFGIELQYMSLNINVAYRRPRNCFNHINIIFNFNKIHMTNLFQYYLKFIVNWLHIQMNYVQ